jgi:hypothetical protein
MHRAIVVWLTQHPWRAAVASAVCGAISVRMTLPFLILAGAIPVLVGLRYGAGYALGMAATAGAAALWVILTDTPPVAWTFIGIGLLFFGPVLLALLLKRTGSLNFCLQIAVLGAAAVLVLIYVSLPDPVGMWVQLLDRMLEMMDAGLPVEGDQKALVAAWARTMWGALAALVLASVFGCLLLGRWWQSLLDAPGAFGVEYRRLRLGIALGVATTVLFIAAVVSDSALLASLVWVASVALAFQGLAAAHRSRAVGRLGRGWLVAIYVLLIVLPVTSIVVFVLAIWGFADNWLRPRPQSV